MHLVFLEEAREGIVQAEIRWKKGPGQRRVSRKGLGHADRSRDDAVWQPKGPRSRLHDSLGGETVHRLCQCRSPSSVPSPLFTSPFTGGGLHPSWHRQNVPGCSDILRMIQGKRPENKWPAKTLPSPLDPGLFEDEGGSRALPSEYGTAPLFQEVPAEVRAGLLKRVIP